MSASRKAAEHTQHGILVLVYAADQAVLGVKMADAWDREWCLDHTAHVSRLEVREAQDE